VAPIVTERLYIDCCVLGGGGCASTKWGVFYSTSSVDPFKLFKQLLKLFVLFQ